MKKLLVEASNGNLPESMLVYVNNPDGSKSVAKLNVQAAKDFNRMVADAMKDGVKIKLSGPNSGYRNLGSNDGDWKKVCKEQGFTQWCAWKKYKAGVGNLAAVPGQSNHGWGSAVDVANCESGSKVHKWLVANSKKYGFYPLATESWHWDHKASVNSLDSGGGTPTGSLPKDNSEPSTNIPKDSNSDSEIKKFGSSFSDSDIGNFLKIFSPDYENFSREEKNRALLPIFSMLGFDTLRDLLDNPNVIGKKDEDGDVQDAINQIKNKMDSKDLNTTSVSDKISSLPPKIKNAIARLKNEYGITITDEHIRKEFEQEGNYREDAGGENSEARKNIEKLVQDAKLKFGGKIPKNAIISGYRGYDDQVKNFGSKAKSRGVDNTQKANTIPGFSQHHTGKAFDIFSVDTSWWNRNSDVKEWVAKNAKNYGFDVTYKTQGLLRIAEPWHLYYVGGETISEHAMGKIFEITEEILRFKTLIK